ncbi:TolC family protein [Parvularcula sp. IMCC14364]|uniref:TolC family protein n=1 Tax=Parvularcula sp. IMCC14364 TaxID=3067902 RepID=UPI002741A720|nr:TolC family protein [Parvularcula sp. IMCC14364]
MTKNLWGAVCALSFGLWANTAAASPCSGNGTAPIPAAVAGAPLTLQAVLAEIRQASPAVRSAGLEIRARKAETRQAGRTTNPSLSAEMENFAGSGAFSGYDQTETTYSLEQTFRLGGKRRYAERAANARAALASAECAVILHQSQLEGAVLFFELVSATELASIAVQASDLASEFSEIVEARVAAGAAAPPEFARARAEAVMAMALVTKADAEVTRRQYDLVSLWGESEWPFGPPLITDDISSAMPADTGSVTKHPDLQQAEAATNAVRAQSRFERSNIVPDVTLSAGYRRFEETDDSALIAGLNITLPLFDRNRDAFRASQIRTEARAIDKTAIEARLLAELRATITEFNAATERRQMLADIAVPAAMTAYDASVRGYRVGKFDLTSTIDARRALIETRKASIEANLDQNIAEMKLRSLTGTAPFNGEFDAQ